MLKYCDACARHYDDEYRSTICPHDGMNGLCVKHDLYACRLCKVTSETERNAEVPISKRFSYHKPSLRAVERITRLRKAFSDFEDLIEEVVPEASREKSLALTKLEEAALFANKAVTHNDPESVQDTDHAKLSGDAALGLTESAQGR